ncbi:copper resistance protein CopC [Ornithinimicrobium sp. F0845]|uniref:copper resistance CopC family protein n=1 Tax=Ornithinimicrobium sp. F0845 TaxID=2926412 RepID=UPI001FF3534D|nr:copper resistance protein CopC [Ornithinimicrobium sp. F0845]
MFTLLDRGRRPGGRAALGTILLAFCLTLLALPASAHDTLTDSSPSEGEVLQEVPTELRLTFSGEISDLGVQFVVTGPEGRDVVQGTPTVDGTAVTQALAEELADGDYEAAWRVTSSDGHPISGIITFTIEAGSANETATGTPEPTAAPTTEASTTEAPTTDASPTEDPTTGGATTDVAETTADTAAATDPGSTSQGMPFWGWLVAGVAAVGLVACGFLAFRRN